MRTLPKNKSDKQKLIIEACQDFFGRGNNSVRANQIALFLMGRKRGVFLSQEEIRDMSLIRANLDDEIYTESFL